MRLTVDYGIDLGTTNSVVARMDRKGPKTIDTRWQSATLPSAVGMDERGRLMVGPDALTKESLHAAVQFKRDMGTGAQVTMRDRSLWTPQRLSAEILKELKASVARRCMEDLASAVVTVPAMFLQPQCQATHEAAELAGLRAVALLQEPIAAATAYLSEDAQEGYYLVYDLGGGTFDVSLIRLRSGQMEVIAHGGDNYLGGRDFDLACGRWARAELQRSGCENRRLDEPAVRWTLRKEVEQARIRLTDMEETEVDLTDVGLGFIPFDRPRLELLVGELVDKTVELTRRRLFEAKLAAAEVRSLLLVGGPTQMPLVRSRLGNELGIPLSVDQNPLTVVAEGAALYASTLLIERGEELAVDRPTAIPVELNYEPVTADVETSVAGRILSTGTFEGEVRISREPDWDTGWIRLRDGAFLADVALGKHAAAEFHLELRSNEGTIVDVVPPGFSMRRGVAPASGILPYHYGVAVADGDTAVMLRAGDALPATLSLVFAAARDVAAKSTASLPIYIVEGNNPVAKENTLVGLVEIKGTDLTRSVREGDRIEVRLRMDESRLLTVDVHLPIQDQDYSLTAQAAFEAPDPAEMQQKLDELREDLAALELVAEDERESTLSSVRHDLELIEADLDRVRDGNVSEGARLYKKVSDAKAEVGRAKSEYRVEIAYCKAVAEIEDAERIADMVRSFADARAARSLRTEAERAKAAEDSVALLNIAGRAEEIFWPLYVKTPDCWLSYVNYLRSHAADCCDAAAYHERLLKAEDCAVDGDYLGARLHCAKASDMLPRTLQRSERFADAGLRLGRPGAPL